MSQEPMELPDDERPWYRRLNRRALAIDAAVAAVCLLLLWYIIWGGKKPDGVGGAAGSADGAVAVFRGYGDNPIEDDAKYKGRRVKALNVSIDHISRDKGGRAYVAPMSVLVVGGSRPAGGGEPFPGLKQPEPCYYYYLRSDADAAGVKLGETYDITGRCLGYRKDGFDRGVAGMDWRVEFEDCTLERSKPKE